MTSSRLKILRRLVWSALVVAAVAFVAAERMNAAERTEKGTFAALPAFSLRDQHGSVVTHHDFLGHWSIVNFVYTRCPSVCPLLTARFKDLQQRLGALDALRYVSITVDPEHDTPEVLRTYAARFGAGERWRFLTGPLAQIEKTVVHGFKLHLGKPAPNPSDPSLVDIMHGEHFVLVDPQGTLRGYYRSDHAGLSELERDVRKFAAPD